jgi:hypothetical protein
VESVHAAAGRAVDEDITDTFSWRPGSIPVKMNNSARILKLIFVCFLAVQVSGKLRLDVARGTFRNLPSRPDLADGAPRFPSSKGSVT